MTFFLESAGENSLWTYVLYLKVGQYQYSWYKGNRYVSSSYAGQKYLPKQFVLLFLWQLRVTRTAQSWTVQEWKVCPPSIRKWSSLPNHSSHPHSPARMWASWKQGLFGQICPLLCPQSQKRACPITGTLRMLCDESENGWINKRRKECICHSDIHQHKTAYQVRATY